MGVVAVGSDEGGEGVCDGFGFVYAIASACAALHEDTSVYQHFYGSPGGERRDPEQTSGVDGVDHGIGQ